MSEIEGEPSDGLGRCVIVLMGLGAGGHSADVLNAVSDCVLAVPLNHLHMCRNSIHLSH